ncbi:E3 UBIQUITIN-PROTEIN LIGASE BAH1 [Salix viminalis]|uniref:RING-type E3 ubiquitin transferase n=1 Tax=Salix viminalis TaxID=40686 RepID=A0A9Q0ZCI2_SALVM|nr:E3 UBIQUITIN-PROTEIN LIGASE BAH1 [Salix viminalis]
MSAVVGCFNERAQKLLELHLASGFRKYFMWLTGKLQKNHVALIQEGKDLVTYALINAIAVRKILKKYDKIHYSKQGQNFKSKAQSMHMEILQSPWLCELMAFPHQSKGGKGQVKQGPCLIRGIDIDLTCSICLDTVFDPVSLTCGHIFCHTCACSAASVTIVDGLKAAEPNEKCPLCRKAQKMKTGASRQTGVYEGSLHLEEINILLSRSCHEHWEQRLQTERRERIRQVKEHWESQCRAFTGV